MSVPCRLGVIFALIAVSTPRAASTAPVRSAATPWHPMGAAARVNYATHAGGFPFSWFMF